MTAALSMIVAGGVLLLAAIRDRTVVEVMRGITSPSHASLTAADVPIGLGSTVLVGSGTSSRTSSGRTPRGSSTYRGVEICNWIIAIIRQAERDVGPLYPTSGVRHGVDPHTASGQTEHSGCTRQGGPGSGAVDFGGYGGSTSAEKFRAWLQRNGNPMRGGDSYGDFGHFSLDGH